MAPEADSGLDGAISPDGTTCTASDGTEVTIDIVAEYLNEPESRYALLNSYYEFISENDISDCITFEEVKQLSADEVPALSDTCVTDLLNSSVEFLATK